MTVTEEGVTVLMTEAERSALLHGFVLAGSVVAANQGLDVSVEELAFFTGVVSAAGVGVIAFGYP